jgi:hypothetical protein
MKEPSGEDVKEIVVGRSEDAHEGNVASNDTESVGKSESRVELERRQKKEVTKTKDASGEDVKKTVVGSSEDAREGNVDSNDTGSVGKSESGVEEEYRRNRQAAKTKDTSGEDVKGKLVGSNTFGEDVKEIIVGSSEDAREGDVDSNDTESEGKSESGVKEECRQKREAAKTKDTSGKDVKAVVVGSSEDACRRQLAFRWYSQMHAPNRSEFKQQLAALSPLYLTFNDVTPDDVDLLPWNATGSKVNIAEMNALTRASIMKPKQ